MGIWGLLISSVNPCGVCVSVCVSETYSWPLLLSCSILTTLCCPRAHKSTSLVTNHVFSHTKDPNLPPPPPLLLVLMVEPEL